MRVKAKTYGLAYSNHIGRWQEGFLRDLRRVARTGVPVDTGTLKRRVDYKVLAWNDMVVGNFEPTDISSGEAASKYYDSSKHKYPSNNPYDIYKQYMQYNLPADSWGMIGISLVESFWTRELRKQTDEFFKKFWGNIFS